MEETYKSSLYEKDLTFYQLKYILFIKYSQALKGLNF